MHLPSIVPPRGGVPVIMTAGTVVKALSTSNAAKIFLVILIVLLCIRTFLQAFLILPLELDMILLYHPFSYSATFIGNFPLDFAQISLDFVNPLAQAGKIIYDRISSRG